MIAQQLGFCHGLVEIDEIVCSIDEIVCFYSRDRAALENETVDNE